MPARTTRFVFSFTSPSWVWPSLWKTMRGTARRFRSGESGGRVARGGLGHDVLERDVLRHVIVVERGRVEQPHLRPHLADLEAALLQLRRVGKLEHDLVAALA